MNNAPVHGEIHDRLFEALAPAHLDVINESHRHSSTSDPETHFKVVVVSDQFAGQSLVQRHRGINTLLADLLAGPVHALGLHTWTVAEWKARGEVIPKSPPCRGGAHGHHSH